MVDCGATGLGLVFIEVFSVDAHLPATTEDSISRQHDANARLTAPVSAVVRAQAFSYQWPSVTTYAPPKWTRSGRGGHSAAYG